MRSIRSLPVVVIMALSMTTARAQQELMVSQYMFNGLFLNPAYAGSHPYVSGTILHRAQWLNVPGAPQTSLLGVDGPVLNNKMGLGFTLTNDVIGISRDMDLSVNYAYRVKLGTGHLAFGLKAGVSMYTARLSDLTYWDPQDALYQQNIKNAAVPKFGFGMYWSDDRSYIGISIPTLYAADKEITKDLAPGTEHYFQQHFYLNAGQVFELNEAFDLKPSILIKYQQQAPPEVDLNCNVLYKERLWLGVGYRTGDAFVGMVEYQITPIFRAGYSYDMTTSVLRTYTSGSHEIMLGVDLGRDPIKIKTPRYF